VIEALRLSVGTLTILPVRPPQQVDRRVAQQAMCLAPAVGMLLGGFAAAVIAMTRLGVVGDVDRPLGAALAVTSLALVTRGIHLDGLADTADGLGSGRHGRDAVALMHQPVVGAFAVMAVVLTVLVQVSALDVAQLRGRGTVAIVGAVVTGRLALTWVTRWNLPVADGSRLGAGVGASVRPVALVTTTVITAGVIALVGQWDDDSGPLLALGMVVAMLVALALAMAFVHHCARRFGGITGDVMGSACELATTTFLVLVCLQ